MDKQQRIGAASSSSTASSKKYDVFLSFRGEDTRMNFTSLLYDALTEAKIETFIDNLLEKGDEISPALIKAIENSHILVVIFSENYASSKWCLNELIKIMEIKKEKGKIVIPVFYNIDPSHVRNQTGSYKEAFAKHEGESMCSKWKAALTEAANLVGWDSRNRTESEFLKDIVRDVLRQLAPTYPNQFKRLVGIEKSYEEIESLLKMGSSEVIILGIWGMGGIGKTTLATALYDKLSYEFEGRCFLANVREKSYNLTDLRDELFSKLLENKTHGFDNFDMSRLQRRKLLVVLDDVSTPEQLEKLIAEYDFLGAGSRVIVTTRDKQILSTVNKIYPVEELNSDHSLQLFCLTAFGEKQPKQGYEDLSRRVIFYCKGVPLALKVLGANLRSRNEKAWECELRKLEKIPNPKIHNVLKLSYDDLGRSERDIFLDIACFFKGKERDRVTEILEAFQFFPESGIEVLLDKTLITISNDNQIEMHDLIQEMGREIVHQQSEKYPEKRSRMWKHEEVVDVLKYEKGTSCVEGIILDLHTLNEDLHLSSTSLANMSKMRFLKIYEEYGWSIFNVFLHNGLVSLSDKLMYLHWDRFCHESLSPNFCAEQLVELRMCYSNLKKLWDGVQNLSNLKKIDLSYSQNLIEIPDLSKAEKLEKVFLVYCKSLHQVHPSMLSLPKLTNLHLSGCRKIEKLESNVHSKSLCVLRVEGCSSLREFSVTSEKIRKLDFSDTNLYAFSPSIGHLLSLELLDLNGTIVESLPANIKNLSMLTSLRLDCCRQLKSLSDLPPLLRKLHLNHCQTLVSLSKRPPSLKELHLNNCKKLMSLPKLPPSLVELHLNKCKELVSLPELPPSLRKLFLNHCRVLVSLPKLPPCLKHLPLNKCWKLMSLPKLPPSLIELSFNDCRKLTSLPKLPPSLRKLPLNNCLQLMSLSKLPSSLRVLSLNNCSKLVSLPKLPPSLKNVSAFNCISLDTDITQGLVLEHISRSRIPYLHEQYLNDPKFRGLDCFIFPGDHVTNKCWFKTSESSITISDFSKSDLLGFICCIPFSAKQDLVVSNDDAQKDDVSEVDVSEDDVSDYYDKWNLDLSIYIHPDIDQMKNIHPDGMHVHSENFLKGCQDNFISNHVFFSYVDICLFERTSEVYDQLSNITFKFAFDFLEERIKGCGIFPVYATTLGLKLVNCNTMVGHDQEKINKCGEFSVSLLALGLKGQELVEMESVVQISDSESQASNNVNEDEDDLEQLLPASKRQRTSPDNLGGDGMFRNKKGNRLSFNNSILQHCK